MMQYNAANLLININIVATQRWPLNFSRIYQDDIFCVSDARRDKDTVSLRFWEGKMKNARIIIIIIFCWLTRV